MIKDDKNDEQNITIKVIYEMYFFSILAKLHRSILRLMLEKRLIIFV